MVGIAQDDFRAQRFQFGGRDGFDTGLGAHRHIDLCGNRAVRSLDGANAGGAARVAGVDGEGQGCWR